MRDHFRVMVGAGAVRMAVASGAALVTLLSVLVLVADSSRNTKFMPFGAALNWNEGLLMLTSLASMSAFVSCTALAGMLLFVMRFANVEERFRWIFLSLAAFIFSSGLTRVVEVLTTYHDYHVAYLASKIIMAVFAAAAALSVPSAFPLLTDLLASIRLRQETADRRADETNNALRQANHAKDEFLSIISHELRTPMTSVLGWVQLLKQVADELPEATDSQTRLLMEGLKQVEISCHTQARLVDDLLDMSRLTVGTFRVSLQPVDVRSVVEECVAELEEAFAVKGIRLVTDLEGAPFVKGDPSRMRQVVWKLLYNALNFTDKGAVYLTLWQLDAKARLMIRDTGRGIPPETLPQIFDRLSKASGPPSTHGGGLGIGLSLVKTIIDLMGGSIRAESEGEGKGATFMVDLPLL